MNNQSNAPFSESQASQDSAPSSPAFVCPPIPPKPHVRRVGVFTMGISLIVAGVVALITIFFPGFDLFYLLKWTPVIFIILGAEILIAAFRHKEDKIRFDFLSAFICFILVCAAIGVSAAAYAVQYINPASMRAQDDYRDQIEDQISGSLSGADSVLHCWSDVHFPYYLDWDNEQDILSNARVTIHAELAGPYTDTAAFAEDALDALEHMKFLPYRFQWVQFSAEDENGNYHLYLDNPFAMQWSEKRLEGLVEYTSKEGSIERSDLDNQLEILEETLLAQMDEHYEQLEERLEDHLEWAEEVLENGTYTDADTEEAEASPSV